MNIQFVISEDIVYVIEVNPRASRTVPIMSKVTGIPMVEWATNVQLGESLRDMTSESGLLQEPAAYAVKAPVFSASKLKGVDHILSPEMKSTGEVLGLGNSVEEALQKALLVEGKQSYFTKKVIFCSISDVAKEESLPIIQELINQSFRIIGTKGTVTYLTQHGIEAESIDQPRQSLEKLWKEGRIGVVLNVPTQGRNDENLGFYIRELSTRFQVPCFTSLDTLRTVIGLKQAETLQVKTLEEYIHDHEKVII